MDTTMYINGREIETEVLTVDDLVEIKLKKILKEGKGVKILSSKYHVGTVPIPLSYLDIDDSSKVTVTDEEVIARVFYPCPEFSYLTKQEGTRIRNINGREAVEATAVLKKKDVIHVLSHELPKNI